MVDSGEICQTPSKECDWTASQNVMILGDLSVAIYHLSSYEILCKHEIQMSVIASDPEDPLADETYSNLLNGFLNTTCPNTCSGQGVCVEGLCSCRTGWMGSDCSIDADTPPTPEYYESPDVCDVTLQPCMSVTIHAKNLVTSDKLSCRVKIVMIDGSSQIFHYKGTRASTNSVRCPLPNLRTLGSSANRVSYNYSISLSNNAVIYQDMTSEPTRVVLFSEWMFWECLSNDRRISKDVSCVIEATCHAAGEMKNSCYGCHPDKSHNSWTPKIDLEEDTNLSPWSAYGPCSKDCDYGLETRTRQCTGECCGWGSTSQSQLCNDHNCQELEEERYEGLKITITGLVMKQFVEQEVAMIGVITDLINSYTKQHPAEFCQALNLEPVTSPVIGDIIAHDNTTTSQGYPKAESDDIVITKVVTVVSESKTSGLCVPVSSTRRRRTVQDDVLTLDGHYMVDALVNIEASLEQLYGLDIDVTLDVPEIVPEKPDDEDDMATLILATAIPVIIIIIATAIAVPMVLKYKNRNQKYEIRATSSATDEDPYVNAVVPGEVESYERLRFPTKAVASRCPPN